MLRIHLFVQNPYESIYGLESEYISFFVIEYEYNYSWRDMDLSPKRDFVSENLKTSPYINQGSVALSMIALPKLSSRIITPRSATYCTRPINVICMVKYEVQLQLSKSLYKDLKDINWK